MRIAKAVIAGCLAAGSFLSGSARAQNDALIFIHPLRGSIGFTYEKANGKTSGGGANSESTISYLTEHLSLANNIDIYHPRFLQLGLGVNLDLIQGGDDVEGRDTAKTGYFITARLLPSHPYSMNAHYRKSQTEFEQSPTIFSLLHRRETGVGLELKERLGMPLNLSIQYTSVSQQTENIYFETVTGTPNQYFQFDETTQTTQVQSNKQWEKVDLKWEFFRKHFKRFLETNTNQVAALEYQTDRFTGSLSGKAGDKDRFQWNLGYTQSAQTTAPESEFQSVNGGMSYQIYNVHSNALGVSLGAGTSEWVSGDEITTSDTMGAGLSHRLYQSLRTNLNVRQRETTNPNFTETEETTKFNTRYSKKIPDGRVSASFGVSETIRENTGSDMIVVVDEAHVLTGSTPAALNNQNIILTGPAPVVTDASGAITYTAGTDYLIYQIAGTTFIERFGPGILDGDTVLVDYSYLRPRGDSLSRSRGYSVRARWRFLEPYYSVNISKQEVREGGPELEASLNPSRSTIYGIILSGNVAGTLASFKTEWEENRQRLDPFQRNSQNGSVWMGLSPGMKLRVFTVQNRYQYVKPGKDSDNLSTGAEMAFARGRMSSMVKAQFDKSSFGTTEREVLSEEGAITVTYGQWVLEGKLRFSQEDYQVAPGMPVYNGEFSSIKIGLRRLF